MNISFSYFITIQFYNENDICVHEKEIECYKLDCFKETFQLKDMNYSYFKISGCVDDDGFCVCNDTDYDSGHEELETDL